MIKKILLFILISLFIVFIALAGAAVWAFYNRDLILKESLTKAVTEITGFKTHITGFHYDPPGYFYAEGVTLHNPPPFEDPVFARASRMSIDIDISALYRERKLHLKSVHVDLDEINIEKGKDGMTNVRLLKTVARQNLGLDGAPSAGPKPKSVFIDRLEIVSKKITYRDATGVLPKKFVTDLKGKEKVFEGLPDSDFLINIILAETMKEGKMDSVVLGLGPIFFERSLKGFAVKGKHVTKETVGVLAEGAEIVVIKAPEVIGEKAEDALKVTAEGMKEAAVKPLKLLEKVKPESSVKEEKETGES